MPSNPTFPVVEAPTETRPPGSGCGDCDPSSGTYQPGDHNNLSDAGHHSDKGGRGWEGHTSKS